MDNKPRPRVHQEKKARDRLIRLAEEHPDWVIGFEDETWWSRLARPSLSTWTEACQSLRLVEQSVAKDDPDPKALACYGLLMQFTCPNRPPREEVWLRFVDGHPISSATTAFLKWGCGKLERYGKKALLLVWDNASWHISLQVRVWLREHNRLVKCEGKGVRIIMCPLPIKSPWLNPIEPRWAHGKRRVIEADRLLTAQELIERVYACFGCEHEQRLFIPQKVA